MNELNPIDPEYPSGRGRTTTWPGLLAAALLICTAIPAGSAGIDDAPARRPIRELGFTANGEVRRSEDGLLSIAPWAHRLPARVEVKISNETRILRQKKADLADVAVGDLVLVVEQPPNSEERKSRKLWEAALKKKRRPAKAPERVARIRALVRCWKATRSQVSLEDRQAARALLNGAMPFFRGPGRGRVKPPSDDTAISVGIVQSLAPFSVRNINGTVKYRETEAVLVIDHEAVPEDAVKNGQTVLVHSPGEVTEEKTIAAAIVAISPRPKLAPVRERRLIIRERKKSMAGAGE